jgi:splicing factor 45
MALLCHKFAIGEMDVALIQEPWVYGDRIRGLHNRWGILFSAGPGIDSRACISVRNTIQAFPLLELCSRDVVMVRLSFNGEGSIRDLIVTSAYLPYDSDEPPPSGELWDAINYCCRNNLQLIAGYDANAHHIVWGSTGISPRGSSLLEYLVSANLNILNKGNEPTFVVSNK